MSLEFNGTEGVFDSGRSAGVYDMNLFYDSGNIAWIMVCSALVLLMIPGVGFFYAGLARRKSALSLIFLCMMSTAVVGFQWFFWGYTLTFSHTGSTFLGDMSNFGLKNVVAHPSVGTDALPDILFCLYQGISAPRLRRRHPVHISSGVAALAYALMLGRRSGYDKVRGLPYRPHNVTHVVLGTVFLWVGWFGFNGGSALSSNIRAVMACYVTNLAACVGAFTWTLLDFRLEGKWSTIGFCSGALSGLLKFLLGIDEGLDVFAVHGVGGIVGNLLTGIFAAPYMANLDGSDPIDGGWISRNFIQLGYQLAGTVAGFAWSFVLTCLILFLMNLVPGLSLRVTAEEEELGLDDCQLGEFAYDYVELRRNPADSLATPIHGSTEKIV
ncbi:unnamed protein product [Parascedosporium putredinis]|uniref:Ammonium transporter AmtB-like domain-containing protein n=1 Tax=Parascedosporium putredinis TaxID=1442378 RepID=A0A9P1M7T7_9PEZI|nr:unnamed protein product [Parascedosporium putredinis]CAI7991181.1 unnamed protein product [Parascedosporium putredinis]